MPFDWYESQTGFFLQFDWSKGGLSMDLSVFIYSHTVRRPASNFFQDREEKGQLFMWFEIFISNHAERTLEVSCFVLT